MGFFTRTHETGAALAVGLIVLVVVTLLGLAAVRSNTLELRMASNAESKNLAFQQAQAAIDFVVVNPDLLPVTNNDEDKFCSANVAATCTQKNIDLPSPLNDASGGTSEIVISRKNPINGLPPRLIATDSSLFGAAYFHADSVYDDSANGGGRTALGAGLMRVMPK